MLCIGRYGNMTDKDYIKLLAGSVPILILSALILDLGQRTLDFLFGIAIATVIWLAIVIYGGKEE